MQLSKNYQKSEFEVSVKGKALGLDNTMPDVLIPNLKSLVVNLLQPLNDYTGWNNDVNSGYRSKEVNEAVGGVESSQHRKAEASDNMFFKRENAKKIYILPVYVLRALKDSKLDFDQCILYNGFVHLSFTTARKNRKMILFSKDYKGLRE